MRQLLTHPAAAAFASHSRVMPPPDKDSYQQNNIRLGIFV
jgi:hypothetical protein